MFDWFKKKQPALETINAESLYWSVGQMNDPQGLTIVRWVSDRRVVRHPELPIRLGVAIEHQFQGQKREMDDPLYGEIEDRLFELLSGPPLRGVNVLILNDGRMKEWVSYMSEESQAEALVMALCKDYELKGLTCMSASDPKWQAYKAFTPGR